MSKIPKVQKPKQTKSSVIQDAAKQKVKKFTNENNCITFSFESLQLENDYFCLDGTCENWSKELLVMLSTVSKFSEIELRSQAGGKTLRFHYHNNEKAQFNPPCNINPEEFSQIRISKSKGGIHGVLVGSIFYVIWLDPHHNMYPDDRYGGLKRANKPAKTCCKDRDEEIERLMKENEELIDMLDKYTS